MDNHNEYRGILAERGKVIDTQDAMQYVLAQCGLGIVAHDAPLLYEALNALEEWFFSGNWIKVCRSPQEGMAYERMD